ETLRGSRRHPAPLDGLPPPLAPYLSTQRTDSHGPRNKTRNPRLRRLRSLPWLGACDVPRELCRSTAPENHGFDRGVPCVINLVRGRRAAIRGTAGVQPIELD